MLLQTNLTGVSLRRSLLEDASGLEALMRCYESSEGVPSLKVFGGYTKSFFAHLIETSALSLTAVSPDGKLIIGFCSFSSSSNNALPNWEETLEKCYQVDVRKLMLDSPSEILGSNTLWLNFLIAPSATTLLSGSGGVLTTKDRKLGGGESSIENEIEQEVRRNWSALVQRFLYESIDFGREMLRHMLGTQQHINHILCTVSENFDLLKEIGFSFLTSDKSPIQGELHYLHRHHALRKLSCRLGRIEDYDDFVPLLVNGTGVITKLPEDFFLEELLKDQNENNKVLVAEETLNHHLVGMVCMRVLSPEEQQLLSKRYQTEAFRKFSPIESGCGVPANLLMIDFLYFNPDFEFSVIDFIEYIYTQFPEHEFCAVCLPHDLEEPAFLSQFRYLPIRKYQPHNARGENLPVPEGMWVHCRYYLDPLVTSVVKFKKDFATLEEFMDKPHYCLTNATLNTFREDARTVANTTAARQQLTADVDAMEEEENIFTFQLVWGKNKKIVGFASAQRMSIADMYTLRANYNVDEFVHFNLRGGYDYSATTIALSYADTNEKFYSEEMPGIVIRSIYVLPFYDEGFKPFVDSILRFTHCDVAVVLTNEESSTFSSVSRLFLPVKPRRVREIQDNNLAQVNEGMEGDKDNRTKTVDVHALDTLFLTTKRCLADTHHRINTRIVIVGASTTGLAFLYRLLSIPYAHFTNIVLISIDGLPPHINQKPNKWHVDQMELLEREHALLFARAAVRVVTGALVDLDKVNRFVSIDNGVFEPYDYLILATGRQYVTPPIIRTLQQQEGQSSRAGVVPLSNENSIDKLIQTLRSLDRDANNVSNILVYGSGIEAFAIVNAILNEGFSSQRVVVCRTSNDIPATMSAQTYQAMIQYYKHLGTSVLQGYDASRLEFDDDSKLNTVVLEPVSHERAADSAIELSCGLIVCAETKDIDPNILSTLNKRSIVFDGRVIVENNYRTTDAHVFAAGPVAMFTRRYGATESFDDFNAKDVGFHLAEVLLGFMGYDEYFDPKFHTSESFNSAEKDSTLYTKVLEENGSKTAKHNNIENEMTELEALETLRKLPQYTLPIARRILFLYNFVFFAACTPTFNLDKCVTLSCTTINATDGYREFHDYLDKAFEMDEEVNQVVFDLSIYVNVNTRLIEKIEYFGNDNPECHNYFTLIGYPESVLSLFFRFKEARQRAASSGESILLPVSNLTAGVVNGNLNLAQYLRLPHLQTVYYDIFVDFFKKLRIKLRNHEVALEVKKKMIDERQYECSLSDEELQLFQKELSQSENKFKFQIQLEIIKFLHEHKDFLPQSMYLPNIQKDVQNSIL